MNADTRTVDLSAYCEELGRKACAAAQILAIADAVRRHGIDGVIATNTSVSRAGIEVCSSPTASS